MYDWYCSPYYVNSPDIINNDNQKQGWVKFGEPCFNSVIPLSADLVIKPETGMMVRFPSYMWHGANAFKSEENHLVVAQDLES